jgi:hypothetical protein
LLAIVSEDDLMRIERDGKQVSGEAECRDALTEHIDALPQRLEEMKLLRIGDRAHPQKLNRPSSCYPAGP